MLSDRARKPEYRREFHREVQALARLRHPGVAAIYGDGTVGEAVAERGPESLVAGAPWMALEHVDGEMLNEAAPRWDFAQVAGRLGEILEALAHAHAREVLHRDLKPSNILVPSDGSPVVLVDFGIAAVFEEPERHGLPESTGGTKGTPTYMAPEQILARWREQGPWTDLYACGCLAWRILCGCAPFDGETTSEVLEAHLEHRRGEFEPRVAVPEGTEAWLERMMAPHPKGRFRRAADAARRLRKLADERVEGRRPGRGVRRREGETGGFETVTERLEASGTQRPVRPPRELRDAPPIPADWRAGEEEGRERNASTLELGLFGLRETPFVDRDAERDHIWEQLREVERTGEPRLVVVVGESGAGKSRLVDWMASRAHELGAANLLWAVQTAGGEGPSEGLAAMIRRIVRGERLGRGEFYEHLCRRLPGLEDPGVGRTVDARALTELVHPTDPGADEVDGPRYRFSSPDQKHALLVRLIRRYARERPAFVWLDDVQWGELARGVVEYLFGEALEPPSALVVATVRAEALSEAPGVAEWVERVAAQPPGSRVELAPLEAAEHRRLVERMLPLESQVVDRLVERTEGNPLFARQLLGDLAERGALEAGERGFRLVEGASLDLPEGIHELWHRRLTRLVEDLEVGAAEQLRAAVERGAALGREVDRREWERVCGEFDAEQTERLVEALVERGLAEHTDQGWAFAHGLLVESLERRARRAGRWSRHHRRCAEMLERCYADRPGREAARRAEHWIEGGRPERALSPLFEEARRLRQLGVYEGALEVLERRRDLLDRVGTPADARRRIEHDIMYAICEMFAGRAPEEVAAALEETRQRAERCGEASLLAEAWDASARCRGRAGEFREARRCAERAVEWAKRAGDDRELAKGLHDLGYAHYLRGELDRAERYLTEGYRCAGEADARFSKLEAKIGVAWIAFGRGDYERSERLFEEILEESREAGFRSLEARVRNGLGEVARFRGEADRAREYYEGHLRLARELGHGASVAVSHENLAQVELLAERFEEVERHLGEVERLRRELTRTREAADALKVIRLTLAAGVGEWGQFDEILGTYAEGWPEDARLLKDHPWLLEMAGEYADRAGEWERAERVRRLARDLWRELGDERAVERLD